MKRINFFSIILLPLFILLAFFLQAKVNIIYAVDAPNTQVVVTQCLSTGNPADVCAQQGVDYLQSHGFPDSSYACNSSQCTVTCGNGASVSVPITSTCPTSGYSCGNSDGSGTTCSTKPDANADYRSQYSCGISQKYCFACPTAAPSCTSPKSCLKASDCSDITNIDLSASCSNGGYCGICASTSPTKPVLTPTPTTPVPVPSIVIPSVVIPSVTLPSPTVVVPTVTRPTSTPPPVCGAPCKTNYDCQGAKNGCTVCGSNNTCVTAPSPTPTNTPTPTQPPFDNSMCTCDGLNFTPIILGTPVNVTAYGKVLGVNKNYAKIPSFTFTFYQSPPNSTQAKKLDSKQVNTTVIEDTTAYTRYQAIWALNLPTTLDQTQTYRIQAHPDCSRKAAVGFFDTSKVVLGAETKQLSFFDKIALFIANLFGGNKAQNMAQVSGPTATPTLTAQQKRNLQLGTFTPATNVTTGKDADNCTFVKFNF